MSRNQRPRTPDYFPRMKYRARGRHARTVHATGAALATLATAAQSIDLKPLTAALEDLAAAARHLPPLPQLPQYRRR